MCTAIRKILWRKGVEQCVVVDVSVVRVKGWWAERKRQSGEMQSSDIRQSLEIQMDGEAT